MNSVNAAINLTDSTRSAGNSSLLPDGTAQGVAHGRGVQVAHGVGPGAVGAGAERPGQRRLNLSLLLRLLLRLQGCDQLGDHVVVPLRLLVLRGLGRAGGLRDGRCHGTDFGLPCWRHILDGGGLVAEQLTELMRRGRVGNGGGGVEVQAAHRRRVALITVALIVVGIAVTRNAEHRAGMLLLGIADLLLLRLRCRHGLEEGLLKVEVVIVVGTTGHRWRGGVVVDRGATRSRSCTR